MVTETNRSGARYGSARTPGPGEFSGGTGDDLGAGAALRRGLAAPTAAAGGYIGTASSDTLDATESRAQVLAGQPATGTYWDLRYGDGAMYGRGGRRG